MSVQVSVNRKLTTPTPARPLSRAFLLEKAMDAEEPEDTSLINLEGVSEPDDPSIETLPDGTIIVSDENG